MSLTAILALLSFGLTLACSPSGDDDGEGGADTDGDGLTDAEEEALGSDPEDEDTDDDGLLDGAEAGLGTDLLGSDSDADGLTDGDEVGGGTDPLAWDSDGDSYGDGDEMDFGSDPLDAGSRIYTGGWPYQADKDAIEVPEDQVGATLKEGQQVPRVSLTDQFGESVDLYDFARQGRPILLVPGTTSDHLSLDMLDYLYSGTDNDWESVMDELRPAIMAGEIYFLFIQCNATASDVVDLYETYPNPDIPLLDDDETFDELVSWRPTFALLDEEMYIVTVSDNTDVQYDDVIDAALAALE